VPHVARLLSQVLAVLAILAVYVSASTYRTPLLWPRENGTAAQAARVASAVPQWNSARAARFPRCHAVDPANPAATDLVVVRLDGTTQRMAFADAWRRTHDTSAADDVWVVGVCPTGLAVSAGSAGPA